MLEKTVVTIKNRKPIATIHRTKTNKVNKANKYNFTNMNFWFSSFVVSSNPLSSERKSH
jgi:hypothetical protein